MHKFDHNVLMCIFSNIWPSWRISFEIRMDADLRLVTWCYVLLSRL